MRVDNSPLRDAEPILRGMIMAVVHAYIEVRELEQGIDFYCRRLGLGLKRRLSRAWVEPSARAGRYFPGEPAFGREPKARTAPAYIRAALDTSSP